MSKFASKGDSADSMELLQTNSANHVSHTVGIAHTRWATHGENRMADVLSVAVRSGAWIAPGGTENGARLSQQFGSLLECVIHKHCCQPRTPHGSMT